ncbi:MAG TPA: hypothetical protein VJP87_09950 [Candidatus Acidoferrales bacterium]|nr:hypothetical protein [Candidatus Acidoferrales bacterium]
MKQQKQLAALAILVVVAGLVWYYQTRRPSSVAATNLVVGNAKLLAIDNPEIHWPELSRAQKMEYNGNGRNPFSAQAAPPPVSPVAVAAQRPFVGPQPPPPPPPVAWPANLKFFGYGTVPNGTIRRGFFEDGDDIFIFSEGDSVLGRYRILKINNTNLEFEELATGRHGTTPLVEDQTGQGPTG